MSECLTDWQRVCCSAVSVCFVCHICMINKFPLLSFFVHLGLSSFSLHFSARFYLWSVQLLLLLLLCFYSLSVLLLLLLCFQRGVRSNANSRGRNLWKLLQNDADKDAKRTLDGRATSPGETLLRSPPSSTARADRTGTVVKNKHRQTVCCSAIFFKFSFVFYFLSLWFAPRLVPCVVVVFAFAVVVVVGAIVVLTTAIVVAVVTPCAPSVEMFFNAQLCRLLLNTHLSRCPIDSQAYRECCNA